MFIYRFVKKHKKKIKINFYCYSVIKKRVLALLYNVDKYMQSYRYNNNTGYVRPVVNFLFENVYGKENTIATTKKCAVFSKH